MIQSNKKVAYSLLVQFIFILVSIRAVYGGQSEQPVTVGNNITHIFVTSRKICKVTCVTFLKSKDHMKFHTQYKSHYKPLFLNLCETAAR